MEVIIAGRKQTLARESAAGCICQGFHRVRLLCSAFHHSSDLGPNLKLSPAHRMSCQPGGKPIIRTKRRQGCLGAGPGSRGAGQGLHQNGQEAAQCPSTHPANQKSCQGRQRRGSSEEAFLVAAQMGELIFHICGHRPTNLLPACSTIQELISHAARAAPILTRGERSIRIGAIGAMQINQTD